MVTTAHNKYRRNTLHTTYSRIDNVTCMTYHPPLNFLHTFKAKSPFAPPLVITLLYDFDLLFKYIIRNMDNTTK